MPIYFFWFVVVVVVFVVVVVVVVIIITIFDVFSLIVSSCKKSLLVTYGNNFI